MKDMIATETLFDYPFNVMELQNGGRVWEQSRRKGLEGFHSLELAIAELHRRFFAFMAAEFDFRTNGELHDPTEPENNDPTDVAANPRFQGETGWYRSCSNAGDRANFRAEDYPEDVQLWIEMRITSFSYDNWTEMITDAEGDRV